MRGYSYSRPGGNPIIDRQVILPRVWLGASVWPLATAATCVTVIPAVVATQHPELDRFLVAMLLAGALTAVAVSSRRSVVVTIMVFLPLLGLLRRLLIADSGWTSYDPLLVVAPALSALLLAILVLQRSATQADLLSRLVLALLGLTVVEVLNPAGASIGANVVGLLFTAAPLLWFFIGREWADRRCIAAVLTMCAVTAVPVAVYGVLQTTVGLPPWDQAWVSVTGYTALNVGGVTRAFGTFPSSAEYATYIAAGLVVAVVALRMTRYLLLPVVAFLVYALFLDSSRGIVILAALSVLIVVGVGAGSARWMIIVTVVGLFAAGVTIALFGSSFAQSAAHSGNPLLVHQIAGLTDPLNPAVSTLPLHFDIVKNGLGEALSHPFGQGPASTNLAGAGSAQITQGTEYDVSNAFVSGGIGGGVLFLAVVVIALRRVVWVALTSRDLLMRCVLGVLIVSLGQWLNGGYYAVAPMVWLLIGWASRQYLSARPDQTIVIESHTAPKPAS